MKKQQDENTVIFDGKKTTFVTDGKRFTTELADGDTYDKEKGVLLAIAKAYGFEYHDICRLIKEARITNYCCFCGKELSKAEQNDTRPIMSERGEFCCDKCNAEIVVPTRKKVW